MPNAFVSRIIPLVLLGGGLLAACAQAAPVHVHEAAAEGGSFFSDLLKQYTPRSICMNNELPVIWLHIISDSAIALAYFTIPLALVHFIRRRKDVAFHWGFICFAVFILAAAPPTRSASWRSGTRFTGWTAS